MSKAPLDLRNPNDPRDWDLAYTDETTPWDLGSPTPEFLRLVKEEKVFGPKPSPETERVPTILVPGCGRGYDVIAFAEAGFSVVGLDFSGEAIAEAGRLQVNRESEIGRTLRIEWASGDFFSWSQELGNQARFDFIIEYTFFCAIDPKRRPEYVAAMKRLLKPSGRLVALFFPFEERVGGPPFALEAKAVEADFTADFELRWEDTKESVKPRRGRERLAILKPKYKLLA